MDPHLNELTHEIIGSAIEVHRNLGPGLIESAYRLSLCRELFLRGIKFNLLCRDINETARWFGEECNPLIRSDVRYFSLS